MKINKKKLGFTLVELLVVIAILAVLATVAIIGYSSFINEAHKSNDNSVVTELNHYLKAANPLGEEVPTATDAAEKLEGCGLNIAELQPSAKDAYYGYNYKSSEFVYIENILNWQEDGQTVSPDRKLSTFVFAKKDGQVTAAYANGYSVYLQKDYNVGEGNYANANFKAVNGLDVGEATVSAVDYTSNSGNTVVIRTNSAATNLTINAKDDTVNHYGSVGRVDAQKIDMECYNEYGKAAYIKITEGKVVAKNGGEIKVVYAANTDSTKVEVTKEIRGSIETGLTIVKPVSVNNEAINRDTEKGIYLAYSVDGNTATADEISAREEAIEIIALDVINEAIENTEYKGVAISKSGEPTQLLTIEEFRDSVNAGNTYAGYTVKLLDDINLGNIEWTSLKLFAGTFDGNNKTLSGLKLNESTDISSGYVDIGFFEKTENATIKNLTIDGFEIYGTGRISSGTLVGNASNGLTLKNVIVTSTNKLTGKWSGGLMGRTTVTMDGSNKRDCKYIIDNCHSSVEIIGERTGGFVGQMDGCNNSIYNSSNGFATFTSCSFDGNVNANKGTAMAAGFIAQFTGGDRTWFVYTYQNCSVNDATIDSLESKGDFTAVSQSAFSIFNCRINDENVILPTQVNFAFCNSKTVYAYSIDGTIYAIKAANSGYYNVESDVIGVDAQVAGSSDHNISLSDTTDWHKVTNAYTDFYGNYIVSADASIIYRSVPTNLEEGTKLQRRTYVAGHDYSANQDTYSFDMWRIVDNSVTAEGTGFGQWQDVGADGATGFVLGAGIYYYLDPTQFVDLNLYKVSSHETSDHWMIYTVTAK